MRFRDWNVRPFLAMAIVLAVIALSVLLDVAYLTIELHSVAVRIAHLSSQVAALEGINKKVDALQMMNQRLRQVNEQLGTTNALLKVTAEKITHSKLLF